MVDRQDIDALLIGSLYGELSSADEARLQAHLESHPADRTALAGLTHARDAVRRSRILDAQLEPPQSVSALLLQEAARRAPRKASEKEEVREGWFARLRRSFLMHPAMAAAAMLVVVIGVAGTLYMRQGDHFASPEVASGAEQARAADTAQAAMGSGAAAAPAPATPPAATAALDEGAYRVGLAEGTGSPAKEAQAKGQATAAALAKDEAEAAAVALRVRQEKLERQEKPEKPEKKDQAEGAKKPADVDRRSVASQGLEVTTPRPVPKDLDDAVDGNTAKAPAADPAPAPESASPSGPGRGFATVPPPPRARAPEAAPPAAPITANATRDADDAKLRRAPGAGTAGGGGSVGGAPAGGEDRGGNRESAPEADAAWAKDQHSRLVTQVRAGRCNDAVSTALALSSRAPGYYQQNVETDRALKACLPLINNAREREAERAQRARAASKRAVEGPAKAAPPTAKPAPTDAQRR
jgi:hypothetical protein